MLDLLELKKSNMVFTASGALKPLRNANLPLSDILIREMIQNSLDASNSNEVVIKFDLHEINTDEIKAILKNNFRESDALRILLQIVNDRAVENVLELSDFGTKGLTGDLYSKLNAYGINNSIRNNYFNLIFDITRSQTAEYSGGSYGLGKTAYFLCSELGMVIYYSRCLNDNGEFEHRLVVSLISMELENVSNNHSTGIMWWGNSLVSYENEHHLLALLNEDAIGFLNLWGLKPYFDNETGTKLFIVGPDKTIFSDFQSPVSQEFSKKAFKWYWPRILKSRGNSLSNLKLIPSHLNCDNDSIAELSRLSSKFKEYHNDLDPNVLYVWDENLLDFVILNREVVEDDFVAAFIKNKQHGTVRSEYVTGFFSILFSNTYEDLLNKIHFVRRPGLVLFTESPKFSFARKALSYIGTFEVNSEIEIDHPVFKNVDDLFKACEDPNHHAWNYKSQEKFVNQIVGSSLRILRDDLYKYNVLESTNNVESLFDKNLSQKLGSILSFIDMPGGAGTRPLPPRPIPVTNNRRESLEITDFSIDSNVLMATLKIIWPKNSVKIKVGVLEGSSSIPIGELDWLGKFDNAVKPPYPIEIVSADIVQKRRGDSIEYVNQHFCIELGELLGLAYVTIYVRLLLKSPNYLIGFKIAQ